MSTTAVAVAAAAAVTRAASLCADAQSISVFRISVIAMNGATIAIDDATAGDTIRSVKQRVFAVNHKLPVHRQRLMYRPGPRGIEPLSDDETLGGAGVAQDGSAELDVLQAEVTSAEAAELGGKLLKAAKDGRSANVRELIGDGADVNYNYGWTALIAAAGNGHVDCVSLLLHAGADKDVKDNIELTALMCAATKGRADCTQLLLDAGADKEATDRNGLTALMRAAREGRADCVRLLLDAGADKEGKDDIGKTALILATLKGHAECVRLLQDAGADKEAKGNDGWTALILAAHKGHADCVRLLMDGGADMEAKDTRGRTALDVARRSGHDDVVHLILSHSVVPPSSDADKLRQ